MKIGILGSGALGLTAALRLQQKGHEVMVIEKASEVGGLLSSVKIGDSYFEKFYHHIFGTDKEIIKLLGELGLGNKLIWQPGKTGTYVNGEIFPLDSPMTVMKFSPLSFLSRLRMGLALAYLKLSKNYEQFENVTATSWIKRWMGVNAYRVIWEPLLRGKFQDNYDQITMSWLWARIYARTPKLGYLRGGFYQLYEKLAQELKAGGAQIKLNEGVLGIEGLKNKVVVKTEKEQYEFDKVLATLPTNLFFKLTPTLSESYKKKYQWDDYFGAQTLVLTLNKQATEYYWLNITDTSFPFLVFVEHTNFMPASDYGGAHLIYIGNYLPTEDPRFKMTAQATFESYLPYLEKLVPGFKREWVTNYEIYRAPYAQPIVKLGYRDRIPPHETEIPGLYLANMAQVYPWDRGQNYSIKLGLEMAEMME